MTPNRALAIAAEIFSDDPRLGTRRFEQFLFWLLRHHTSFPDTFDATLRFELLQARRLWIDARRRA